jgi:serine/threonine protein kinase
MMSLYLLFLTLSSGAFSNVFKAVDLQTGKKVAVKVVRKYEMSNSQVSVCSPWPGIFRHGPQADSPFRSDSVGALILPSGRKQAPERKIQEKGSARHGGTSVHHIYTSQRHRTNVLILACKHSQRSLYYAWPQPPVYCQALII